MKNAWSPLFLGVLALLGAGALLTGCNSTPELTQANALALIQAKYDQIPPVGATIMVSKLGMDQGIAAKYWLLTRVYPNMYWADYTLTPDGKKVLKLVKGGDVIQWRPKNTADKNYSVAVITVAANHLRAHDLGNIVDEKLPGVAIAKGAQYTEGVNLNGVPSALYDIAHNPGNQLSTKRQADYSFENGAWVLHSTE